MTQVVNSWNQEHAVAGTAGRKIVQMQQKAQVEHPEGPFPKTVLGLYLMQCRANQQMNPKDLLIDVPEKNCNMPKNVRLLCGDVRLHCVRANLEGRASLGRGIRVPPWAKERLHLKNFLQAAAALETEKKVVVFIDTNPTLDFFTESARLSSNKLVVPVTADDYSNAALKNIAYLMYGIGREADPIVRATEKAMFFLKAKEHFEWVSLPKIHTVVFNQCNIRNGLTSQAEQKIFFYKHSEVERPTAQILCMFESWECRLSIMDSGIGKPEHEPILFGRREPFLDIQWP